jgi:hypothetical protein
VWSVSDEGGGGVGKDRGSTCLEWSSVEFKMLRMDLMMLLLFVRGEPAMRV